MAPFSPFYMFLAKFHFHFPLLETKISQKISREEISNFLPPPPPQ